MLRKTIAAVSVFVFLAFGVGLATPWEAAALDKILIEEFTLEKGENTFTFALGGKGPAVEYSIEITNGEANGSNRVSSASISINGIPLFKPNEFNMQVGALTASLAAGALKSAENELTYKVTSKPGSYLNVSIYGFYPETQSITYYQDKDGDGYGAPAPVLVLPAGSPPPPAPMMRTVSSYTWVTKGGDCNDFNPLVFPGQGCAPLP